MKRRKRGSRRPKTNRVPRTRACRTWTEAAFWTFLTNGLRGMYNRWPVKWQVLRDARRRSRSANKRLRWEYQCDECLRWFPQKEVQVDHIEPCGRLRSYEDLPRFVSRLFCEAEGLQVLCKKRCHQRKTQRERDAARELQATTD